MGYSLKMDVTSFHPSLALNFFLTSILSIHPTFPHIRFTQLCYYGCLDLNQTVRWLGKSALGNNTHTPTLVRWPALCQPQIQNYATAPNASKNNHIPHTPSFGGNNVFSLDQPVCSGLWAYTPKAGASPDDGCWWRCEMKTVCVTE